MKKKLEMDKKSDKFVQNYLLNDQKDERRLEFEQDHAPHKTDRLTIHKQSLQYVLDSDPWFCDQLVMEKTFLKDR